MLKGLGITGAQGPQGDTGAIGATGPEGPTGPVGIINWITGGWDSGTSYEIDDAIEEEGASYRCIVAHDDQYVNNPTYWEYIAAKGDTGGQGVQGDVGTVGATGDTGYQGPTGPTGGQGGIGVTGPTGPLGSQGIQGEQGIQGVQGGSGGSGIQGEQGPTGPAHEDALNFEAGETIGAHRMVIMAGDGKLYYADKDNNDHFDRVIGMSTNSVVSGETCRIQLRNLIEEASWTWSIGSYIYVGNNGLPTQVTPTTGFIQRVGLAGSATSIFIQLSSPIALA